MRARLFHAEDDWYEWRQEPPLDAAVYVRVALGADGRMDVTELRVSGTLTSELLRSILLGRVEAAANALTDFDGVGPPPAVVHQVRVNSPNRPVEGGWDVIATEPHRRPLSSRIPSRLRNGSGRGRTDEFYAAVARIYRELAQNSARPAIELAEANDAPVTTAHRWIKEARRRGFLGPGRPGKAG